jgi:hypothetical protein
MKNHFTLVLMILLILMPILWCAICVTHMHIKIHAKKEWLKKNKIFLDIVFFLLLTTILYVTFYFVNENK